MHHTQPEVDWARLKSELPHRDPNVVSIVMCVFGRLDITNACLESLFLHEAGEEFELIIVNNGSDLETKRGLEQWSQRYPSITLINQPRNLNFALGNNVGFSVTRGSRVVFLNNDTEVGPEWLRSLLRPLASHSIKGVQPKLLYPDGTIQAIGVVFSKFSPLGYALYAGMPGDFEATQKPKKFKAVTAACFGLRAEDFIDVEGFDSAFINGQEDVDLCLRLGGGEPVFSYAADSVVIHHESKTPGRGDNIEHNRRFFYQRWKDVALADDTTYYRQDCVPVADYQPDHPTWVDLGYAAWRPRMVGGNPKNEHYSIQRSSGSVIAIKIGCPYREIKDHWGDYHFASALAAAFMRKGVVARVDFMDGWYSKKMPCDINLVLRGISRYEVDTESLNLVWVISHPDKISVAEIASYDHAFVASAVWSAGDTQECIPLERLFQCTDICRFNPEQQDVSLDLEHLYVANSRLIERAVVKEAIKEGVEIDIYGEMWEGIAPSNWVKATKIDNVDLPRYYASAKVVLNDHWDSMKEQGFISNRIFDVLACGGNLVTDNVRGIPEELAEFCTIFGNGISLAEAIAEAKKKDRPERRAAAAALISREHSFDKRAGEILSAIECAVKSRNAKT